MAASGIEGSTRLLLCAAGSLLVAPGVALFYGAAATPKARRSAILLSLATVPLLAAKWLLLDHGTAFETSALRFGGTVGACAIMAVAFGGRLAFKSYLTLILLWSILVHDPIAHWTWAADGWLSHLGVLDFAGGLSTHVAAGISSLICAKAAAGRGFERAPGLRDRPATAMGAFLLSLGFLGSTLGAAWAGRGSGLHALVATATCAAGGAFGWLVAEAGRETGKPSPLGFSSSVLVGLAAAAASAGYVSAGSAFAIGVIAAGTYCGTASGLAAAVLAGSIGIVEGGGHVAPTTAVAIALVAGGVCFAASLARKHLSDAPSRDAFSVHAPAGLTGVVLVGILATRVGGFGKSGALMGNVRQLGVQLLGCAVAAGYAALVTSVVLRIIEATMGLYREGGERISAAGVPEPKAAVDEVSGHRLYPEASEKYARASRANGPPLW